VLERGSVEGRVFHRGAVQALTPEETQMETRLNSLVRKELVRPDKAQLPGEDAYRFRHLLIRDAAYEALPKATRAELHEGFATWLEEHGADLVELDEIVGYHLEQAYRYHAELGPAETKLGRRAADRLTAAGRRSYAAGDNGSAANLLGRAVSLAEPAGREGVERLIQLAWSLLGRGEFAEARARNEQAIALAQDVSDRALELRAECELAFLRVTTDLTLTAEEAVSLGREAVRELEQDGDARALAAAWNLVAMGENLRAHWESFRFALERVAEHAARAGDRRLEADVLRTIPGSVFWGPTPLSEGLSHVEALLEDVRGKKALEALVIRAVAGFYGMQGRFDEARELLARARAIHEELAAPVELQTLAFYTGPLELLAGEPASAERELRSACEFFQARGEQGLLSSLAAFLAKALYEQGRFDEAWDWVHVSREAATSDDYNAQGVGRSVEATLVAQRGEFDEAEAVAREAIDFVNRSDELDTQGHVYLGLVEVYRLAGRKEDAVAALEDAIALFERKGNIVMTERSRALRDELSTGW
jgi:tetratricopeptide (TPR) repeat protein